MRPSAERHKRVAPHKSIKVPSCRTFVSSSTFWPFCWADRDSLVVNTPPPTDVSSQYLHFASPPQNVPLGCIIRTPFVVSPSISLPFSCHLFAFSYKYFKTWWNCFHYFLWNKHKKTDFPPSYIWNDLLIAELCYSYSINSTYS